MLDFSSFLCVALCCVFLASWAPTSAHAAAKAITWAYSAQTVTMLTTDTLTISWSNTHDVYYSTTGTCSGGTSKAASSSSGLYTTTSGQMGVGTHYFYCSIGTHCADGMYVTVNVTKGNSAILNPSDVSYTATDINGATKAADWNTDCSWGGTGSCGAGYCTDMSTKPKCDANQLKSPNVAATSIDSAEELAKYTAQTCTQADSTVDERCGATWLNTWMSAGRLGTGGAVAAYCNDKYLVIIGTGATGFTTNMADISQAPGGTYYPDGTTATDCVTSEVTVSSPKMETTAIPLKTGEYRYTLLDTALGSNNFDTFSGGAGDGNTKYLCDTDAEGCFGLPSWTGVGVSTTGQSIYPLYSNVVRITLDACEVDSCNEHVGQGGGQPHLHGDPFHASDTMCHYGPANYTDGTDGHPPVIGFAYDGPTIYGRYLSTSAPGFSDGLDDCGGHEHSADSTAYGGYHYHAQVISATTSSGNKGVNKNANTGKTYPAFTPGPYKCFRGDLSKRGDADYSYWSTNVPVQDTKPCNGMTHYWVKPGLSIPGAGTLAVTLATCDASAAPTNGAVGTCTSTLASGSTCQPTCNTGYTVSGTSSCYDGTLTAATCSASPCDASAAPANGAVGTCSSTLASGSTCQPTCNTGYTVSGTSSCTLGALTAATCSANPCDASAAPVNGAVGDCTSTLASGSTCQPTCNTGYTVSGTSSCLAGTLTAATCVGNPCDASAAPTNGAVGTCTSTLASGSTCQPTCNTGYTVSGTSSCTLGALTAATCSASPCDASAAPANGAVGTCTSTLASGSTCQPTCNTGYTVSGTSSCTLGALTAATCSANPCDASAAPVNGAVGDCTSTLASGSTCQPTCNTGYTVSGTSSCLAGTFTTAECSVAPSPPPPSPPPPAAAAVQAEMQLTGYSAAEFDDDKKTNFKTGMAKYLGVDSAAITITSVVDVTAGRRKLSAVDSVLKVEFTVEATTFSDTTALETKLVVTDVTTMKTELISAGLAVSNIVAPTTITALAPPPSPPPSPPPPASTSPLFERRQTYRGNCRARILCVLRKES
ncbi:unnamed protein product [Bathycoccus prasinos]